MAGETIKTEAICLDIRPWSQTSHVVTWLTPNGKLGTVVKGAVRPKSAFLGQYDLNYTCEILYYARAKGDLHALRDCVPLEMREELRSDYRRLALAGYFRNLVAELAPVGPDCSAWYDFLSDSLTSLVTHSLEPIAEPSPRCGETPHLRRGGVLASPDGQGFAINSLTANCQQLVAFLVSFDLKVLELSGLSPDFSGYDREADWSAFSIESGSFGRSDGRCVRVSREVAAYLSRVATEVVAKPPLWCGETPHPRREGVLASPGEGGFGSENLQIPLDAARVIGVFYQFHLGTVSEVRRAVVGMISKN